MTVPMRRRHSLLCILSGITLASFSLSCQLEAQLLSLPLTHAAKRGASKLDTQIADLYLTAYQLSRKSEQLASQQQWHEAINQAQQAERVLAGIVRDHPLWRTNLVSMRRKIVAENLRNYREQVRSQGARSPRNPIARGPQHFDPERTSQGSGRIRTTELELENGLEIAPGTIRNNRQMYNELMRTREELRRMVVAYKELRKVQQETDKKLLVAQLNSSDYKKRLTKLQESLSSERSASSQVVNALNKQLKELQEQYDRENTARQEVQREADRLLAELTELQDRHELISKEHSQLLAENSRLKEIVELNSPEKTKALLDQNITLSTQLKESEDRVAQLEAQLSAQSDEQHVLRSQLDQARQESDRLRDEVARIYDENLGYRRRISELTESTQQLETELTENAKKPTMDPALKEENQLLRSIVAKQKSKLEEQKKAQALVVDAYKKMKNHNPQMLSSLEQIEGDNELDLTHLENTLIVAVQSSADADVASAKAAIEGATAIREGLEIEALAKGAEKAFAAQRYTAAEQLYRTLVDAHPDHLSGLVNLGSILLHRNKHREAISFLSRASRLSPQQPQSYHLAGTAYYLLDELESAREQFRRALECDPANEDAFFYLANIETINGQPQQALKHLAAAIKLNPQLGDAHYNMARIYIDLGKLADASRAYDRAVQHGATPDLDLENFLRERPDSLGVPGEDLIAAVSPEQEAQIMRDERAAAEGVQPTEDALAAGGESQVTLKELQARIIKDIASAPTPSPAGAGHEMDASLFRSKQITVRGQKIKLRVKPQQEQRLRTRGGPLPELSLSAADLSQGKKSQP